MPNYGVKFSEKDFTDLIEKIPALITDYFSEHWKNKSDLSFPVETLNTLIQACHDNLVQLNNASNHRQGLAQLNTIAYQTVHCFLVVKEPHTLQDQRLLLAAIQIQLEAMRDGYRIGLMHSDVATRYGQENFSLPRENAPPREVHHVHYVYERNTFWQDMLMWDLLLNRSFLSPLPVYHRPYVEPWYPTFPEQRTNKRNSSDDDAASLMFYLMLGAIAAAAAVYGTVHSLRTLNEVVHGEQLGSNLLKLGLVTAAGGLGSVAGLSLAMAATTNPAFCMIAGAIILSSLAYLPLNALQQSMLESQIEGDSRFCLTKAEEVNLMREGFNPIKVNEAIRALAIEMKNTTAYAMKFWSEGNKRRGQIIDTLRMLKSGNIKHATVIVGKQAFKLVDSYSDQLQKPEAYGFNDIPYADKVEVVEGSERNHALMINTPIATVVQMADSATQNASAPPMSKVM